MIISFKIKALAAYYHHGDGSKLNAQLLERIGLMLGRLDLARNPEDMNRPGYGLHPLKGKLKDFYAIKVNKNYRIIFRFIDEDVGDVDYLDYH